MELFASVKHAFRQEFQTNPELVVRAPGRVNLIGEHTDYNEGFVLPMAINRAVWIATRPRTDRRVVLRSLDFGRTAGFDLDRFGRRGKGWVEYVKGVAWALIEDGRELHGWEGVIAGDVPIGAGLSSSAAMEIAVARIFAEGSGFAWDPVRAALAGQKCENGWMGVNSGIMDQLVCARAKAGHALFIDCRTHETQDIPLPTDTAVVILDTSTRRGLVDSAYNERRSQCEQAARFFNARSLRDVSPTLFNERAEALDSLIRRRARHVVTENERVMQFVEAMRQGDNGKLGQLLQASHASLRDDFGVSSRELDLMVGLANQHRACYGARMTGAGFGGCVVALVKKGLESEFSDFIEPRYMEASGLMPDIYVTGAHQGVETVENHNLSY